MEALGALSPTTRRALGYGVALLIALVLPQLVYPGLALNVVLWGSSPSRSTCCSASAGSSPSGTPPSGAPAATPPE